VWGGFAVSVPTLSRFYTLHFLLPFVVVFLIALHVFFLHSSGSRNPLGVNSSSYSVIFHYYYSVKDILGFIVYSFSLLLVTFVYGYYLIDAENFILANPLVTPTHIQPE
jgi:ubiquinol-cytochrome c reductase cytochrome b subunit